ncbi:SpoIID/LytB domain-containing protein [Phycicoccus sp. M110.8]|uniref:SpoIID/LytB domain-containing protein n=1 Tax=Phycicoccus sp. M110.8 TaxID=3075433 RepID=UPI0028FD978E|nr:SpoIID/LytB domain-containing protein [Phycicoccus sp. M110.8]MDU0312704.1 SpoIID/LytB domain-containing protein [Phycicoccus sp. M110.8]
MTSALLLPRRRRVAGAAVLAGGALLAGSALPAVAAADDVVVVGHGWGHGRGMGQYGAYGYVVDNGWKYSTVLNHFYGGTKPGSIGNPVIGVRLLSLEPATDTWVTSDKDFTAGGYRVAGGSAARVVWSTTTNGWRLETKYNGCTTGATAWGTTAKAQTAALVTPGTGLTDTLLVCANNRGYLGSLRWVRDGSATRLVNDVPVESYLRGVVPSESPASWADVREGWGIEALKAQAVAARSYAWTQNRYAYAKTCDTTSCQVYGGRSSAGVSVADPRTDEAISATRGEVRVSSTGAVVSTEFSSSTGGWTAGGAFPVIRDDGDLHSPNHAWTVRLSGAAIATRYGVGTFRQLKVVTSTGVGGSGRVTALDVVGSTRTVRVSGNAFAAAYGLKSTWFYPAVQPVQQATNVRYVRLAHAPEVYRLYSAPNGSWTDRGWVTATDYAASGRPPVTVVKPNYQRLAWSSTVYAVYQWPGEARPQVNALSATTWQSLGSPTPTVVGNLWGTMWWRNSGEKAVYAETPLLSEAPHHVTPAEWQAAQAAGAVQVVR